MVTAWATAGDQPLLRRWRELPVLARDTVVTAVLAPVFWHPGLAAVGMVLGDLDRRPMDRLGHGLLVALWAPLAIRRRRPGLCLAVIVGAYGVHELLGYPPSAATLALPVACFSAGAYQQRYRSALILSISVGCAALCLLLVHAGSPTPAVGFLTIYLSLAACWGAGAWIQARQTNAEQRRQLSVEAAITAERARIARELHDVVTHHVTAMVIQADAAQFLVGDAPVAPGLSAISDTGRLALADLRHLLGVLGSSGDDGGRARDSAAERTPVVGPVLELVEQARRTGQPVELIEDGDPPAMPGGAELAAYRVVQEALTNAIKYAPGRPTSVRIRHTSGESEIEVLNEAPGELPAHRRPFVGGGRGLTGMRERVAVFGGDLVAGPTPDGGFQVQARIPRGSDS
jgi:signal transduction histidine kinase